MTKRHDKLPPEVDVEILWMSDYHHGHTCVFLIGGPGFARIYLAYVDDEVAHLDTTALMNWLLDRVGTSRIKLLKKLSVV